MNGPHKDFAKHLAFIGMMAALVIFLLIIALSTY